MYVMLNYFFQTCTQTTEGQQDGDLNVTGLFELLSFRAFEVVYCSNLYIRLLHKILFIQILNWKLHQLCMIICQNSAWMNFNYFFHSRSITETDYFSLPSSAIIQFGQSF